MKRFPIVTGLSLAVLLSLSVPQSAGAHPEQQHPCAADAKKFCADVEPGQGRLQKCLKQHKKEISPACYEKVKEAKKEVKKIMKICKEERKEYCAEADSRAEIVKCLRAHEKKLSAECRQETRRKI